MQNDPVLTPLFTAALVSAGLPATVAIGTTTVSIAAVLSAATMIAGTLAVAYYMQPDAPKPEQGQIPLKQPVPSRQSGFGEVRLAGYYMLYEICQPVGATGGGASYDVMALCQGPAGGFKTIFLDDVPQPVQSDGRATINSAAPYFVCWVQARRGNKLETVMNPRQGTVAAVWPPAARGDRIVSLSLFCQNVAGSDFLSKYPNGLPKASAAVFLPCWDFRDPLQVPDEPDTWINYAQYVSSATYNKGARVMFGGLIFPGLTNPSGMLWLCLQDGTVGVTPGTNFQRWAAVWKNPVLQVVTYLTNQDRGMGLPIDKLITPALADLTAKAAICDTPLLTDSGAYVSLYTSSPWFKMDTEPVEVLGQIMAACDGWLSLDGNGALSLKVGKFEPPTVTLDESDIISVDLSYGVPDESKVDELQLTYTSPEHNYTTQAADPWRDETAILNRGKVRSNAFGPASVQSAEQVRRLAKRIFLRTNALRGSIVTHLSGMRAAGQRYIQINYPLIPELDGVAVELRRRETDIAQRQCRYEFVLVDPDLLDGWVPAEEEGEAPPPPIVLPPIVLPVPLNVAAEAVTGPPFLIRTSWDDPEYPGLAYRVRWRQSASPGAPFIQLDFDAPADLGARLRVEIPGATEGIVYEIQVASMGPGGTLSDWSVPAYVGTPAIDYPNLDYSDPANSAKWLWAGTF